MCDGSQVTRLTADESAAKLPTRGARGASKVGRGVWLGLTHWPLAAGVGFVVLVARRPESLTAPAFWNEDGRVFYADPNPLDSYNGYLHLVPRLVALAEHGVPWSALLGNSIALGITVAVALFVASDRLTPVMGRARWLAGGFVLVQPALDELLGSNTYANWWLGVYLLLGAFAVPASGQWRLVDRLCLALASLSGPFAIFAAPMYWFRRELRTSALIVSAGAAAQLVILLASPRIGLLHVPDEAPLILLSRSIVEPFIGPRMVDQVPLGLAILFAPVALYTLRHLPVRLTLAVAVILVISLLLSGETTAELLGPYGAQRYFFLPGLLLGLASLIALTRRDWMAIVPAGLLLVGVLSDFRLAPH